MTVRGYLVSLLTVVSVTAVASCIAAEGRLKRYVNLILSVVVMLTLLSPLGTLLGEITAGDWRPPPVGDTDGAYAEVLLEATADAIRLSLCEELALPREEVMVHVDGTVGGRGDVELREITVLLSGESRGARERVWMYLRANTEVPVRVGIQEGQ